MIINDQLKVVYYLMNFFIKFIRAAFYITWFQILMIIVLGGLKYLFVRYKIIDEIQKPFILIFVASLILLFFAAGIIGIIEKRGESFEAWTEKNKTAGKNVLLVAYLKWSQVIPVILWYLMFAYFIAPTTIIMFLILLAGIVIKNIINFFNKIETVSSEKA